MAGAGGQLSQRRRLPSLPTAACTVHGMCAACARRHVHVQRAWRVHGMCARRVRSKLRAGRAGVRSISPLQRVVPRLEADDRPGVRQPKVAGRGANDRNNFRRAAALTGRTHRAGLATEDRQTDIIIEKKHAPLRRHNYNVQTDR
eukprot:scaffold56623_cov66-Phaeocystis_antarctica.AAC.4